MMLPPAYVLGLLVHPFICCTLLAQNARPDAGGADTTRVLNLRSVPQFAFDVGERFVFEVGYGPIVAGEAVMEIPKTDTMNGRECYKVVFRVNSTPSFSMIYRVEDYYETYLDRVGIFPWKFVQKIREGSYRRDFYAEFDQFRGIARTPDGVYSVPPYVHDIISAFYFVRTLDFSLTRVGEKIFLENFYKDKTYPLAVKFLGRQRIQVDAGEFDCIIVEPLIREGGLFKSDGRVIIWLTDDERKIPVKVSTQIVIGSIYAELKEISGINGPIKARVR